ncbi:SRPBCC domain-containing protein [Devosia sp. FKR38]|uniref:SRPBCC domain-containing protein n=1 Tax=Devosia sp. FKR38 TaxID=2562312 RepID=UPI0010C0D457|nr:SRPBCC domain-containing protein [Devosia sp. FKR38]
MTAVFDPERDLEINRIIKAPRARIWDAWTQPALLARWWVPEPAQCRVVTLDLRPGGALVTEFSENGTDFGPHMQACYLDVQPNRQLVFTTALVGNWRPAENPFITAIITLEEDVEGTAYRAHVMHKSPADRVLHSELGFMDGWGTVAAQLARLVEG